MDATHDPARTSWVESANGHPQFPIQNLPLGIFSPPGGAPRPGVAIGDLILDLRAMAPLLSEVVAPALDSSTLNALFSLPSQARRDLRRAVSDMLSAEDRRAVIEPALHPAGDCVLRLPAAIGDYTDFYVGIHHATNVGRLFRPDNPLLPNYKWVPIGYHGRASSVRPSGEPVRRPIGQRKAPDSDVPTVGPTQRLDHELELGIWIGVGNPLGEPIAIADAGEHFVGLSLLNDWSARDFQAWEYQPLGPFLAKNFHTTVSPWVVTAEALTPFRIPQPSRPDGDPAPLDYLFDAADQAGGAFAIELEVLLTSQAMRAAGHAPIRLSAGPASNMYWTVAQILAHHTSNGCNLQPGDLLGTGTISGPESGARGSLLEITDGGAKPVALPTGEVRRFLEDGDELALVGVARLGEAVPIGFGACVARILPARG
ncbi:MAG: fumarylacetoacetase [Caulobacter sp.]|nr:fumarylacetoacetase [Caulobacter sp.]